MQYVSVVYSAYWAMPGGVEFSTGWGGRFEVTKGLVKSASEALQLICTIKL